VDADEHARRGLYSFDIKAGGSVEEDFFFTNFGACDDVLLQKITAIDFLHGYVGLVGLVPEILVCRGRIFRDGKPVQVSAPSGVVAAVEGVGHQLAAQHSDGKTLLGEGPVEHSH